MPSVNPKILVWARETTGLSLEEAVSKLAIRDARGITATARLAALEAGKEEPSRAMLVRMSKQYRRPLLTFYMAEPPQKGDRGQDFRTLPESYSTAANALLDTLVRDIRARQSMVRAVVESEPDVQRLPFIGSMTMSDGVLSVTASIQRILKIDIAAFRAEESPEKAFALLRERTEAAGIFVLLIGNLGSHHTSIDLEAFRGFALADDVAPFVIINDQDARSAWSFTLLHELAHLWLGQTGISGANTESRLERFCNDVAGEFLLPANELALLTIEDETDARALQQQVSDFAVARHLSSSLVAYKLYRSGAVRRQTWAELSEYFRSQWLEARASRRERARDQEGGPNYYVVRRHRVGRALMDFVRRTMAEGELTTLKAGKVLGVQPKNVQTLLEPREASPLRRAV